MATGGKAVRYGCFGCMGATALLLLIVAVVSGLAFVSARPEQVEDRLLTPEIPPRSRGRLLLEIREAEFHLERTRPGEPLRVEARYDVNAFTLEQEFVPSSTAEPDWTYRVTFGKGDRPGLFSGPVSVVRGSIARIDLFVPADLNLDLSLDVKEGGAVVRLGGLWLRSAQIDFSTGAFELDVNEPLIEPMEHLSIRTAVGGALLNNIGNASPRRLDVAYSKGGIDMGLGGDWSTDAEIRIERGIGGGAVHLPQGVIIRGLDRGIEEPPVDPEVGLPILTFEVTGGIGRLEFSG